LKSSHSKTANDGHHYTPTHLRRLAFGERLISIEGTFG
jgi:carbon starvation protein CstA